ncbi:hypothetical protein [Camelimonas lactis]|uniref:Uncharacterized protein n=1 Tax=Camelimonas lactis TaxID=659006 RepID=A0A4R2GSL6_9HYPH|nr:hypothetical protein [Camelimonas lactis]TCO13354.1 hypothetical protein EV666_10664 [Camelimonas lactis]
MSTQELYMDLSQYLTPTIMNEGLYPTNNGTPWLGAPYSHPESQSWRWTLTVDVKQQHNRTLGQAFVTACGGSEHVFAPYDGANDDTWIDFYTGLTVKMSIPGIAAGVSTIYVAQGATSTRYPWYAGGQDITKPSPHIGLLTIKNTLANTCNNVTAVNFISQNRSDVYEIDFRLHSYVTS